MIRARESSRRGVISIRARSDAMERERARERSRQLAQASKEINLFCRWVIDVVDPSGASLSIDRATIIATERSSLRLIPRNQCVKAYFLIPSRRGLPCLSCILSLSLSLSLFRRQIGITPPPDDDAHPCRLPGACMNDYRRGTRTRRFYVSC